ncbi:Putative 2-acylglycerophosphoethanolamine acyltransferase / acyl-acyl carrier protein synthetase [hydrothermal vent metagenome]|uniref:Putative 2-acylglycerophosphoethanolamine acyltransferase / acyl-acyl carrier protein synthetase n=1 Tax=hydrothermal vent metagenome TaxID=652676 RepID=A0A1W1BYR5_9ZZZZ
MKALLTIRGFLPYLVVLLINVVVDIGHKITIQNILLKSYDGDSLIILTAIINAMILLPFILLFSPSGYISDRFAKSIVIRYSALFAIPITILITISYAMGWFYLAFALTFILAIQSAIYSPSKYGLIKELVGTSNLGSANGIVQALTIISILGASILFSIIFEHLHIGGDTPHDIMQQLIPIGFLLILLSSIEAAMSYKLPIIKPAAVDEKFKLKEYLNLNYLRVNIKLLRADRNIWLSIFALGIFWGVGQMMIAAFPAHYKEMTGDENAIIVQGILALSAIGLMVGSILAGRWSKKHIELGIVPLGTLGIFVSLLIFTFSSTKLGMSIGSVSFGFFGGLLIVPLNASIQYFAKSSQLGLILAGNNFIQNIIMLAFLLLSILLVHLGWSSETLFFTASLITLLGSLYAVRELPHLFARILLIPILKSRYSLTIEGIEHLPQSGGVLLLSNHISWIDWLIIQVASPRAIKFVMIKSIYNRWYLKGFLKIFNVIPISNASSKGSIEQIRQRLDNGEVVALFPEGRISYNGQLAEFKRGYEHAVKDSSHPIVPIYLHGLWGSTFSRASKQYKMTSSDGKKRDIIVRFGSPLPSTTTADQIKQEIKLLSLETWSQSIEESRPLHYHWLRRSKANLSKRSIVDALGTDLTNAKMITAVLLFVKALRGRLETQESIGVLLPSSSIGSIINLAILILGKRVVNLNYTLSSDGMNSALQKANIKTVITSEKFLEKLKGKGFDFADTIGDRVLSVESVGASFGKVEKIVSLLQAYILPSSLIEWLYFTPTRLDDVATILFSSGSEGTPKGILLTHKNLLANIKQVSALLNFQDDDVILNSLPIFHSFGLTITTLLPLCEGITMVSAPDPTDGQVIGKLTARYRATIMFGTATFFRLYSRNRKLHPLMFESLRMVVAGAERLKPEIKRAFREKFGIDIYEGYGATETSPVISVNMPDILDIDTMQPVIGNKLGTVGQAIPGTIVKIVDPNSMQELPLGEDGHIIVGGTQVMSGYLDDPAKTNEVIYIDDGIRYYLTGDKGHLDSDGFITIVDRYSRFAKIGGEMISLGSIEQSLAELFGDDVAICATAIDDTKKGEQIVLLHSGDLPQDEIIDRVKSSSIIPIMRPSRYIAVDELPKLGSGKIDFKGAKRLAEKMS